MDNLTSVDHPEPETISRPLSLIGIAVGVGIGTEVVLHSWLVDGGPPGIGVSIAVIVIAVGLIRAGRISGRRAGAPALGLYWAAIGFAALVSVRATPVLAFLNISAAIGLLGAAAAVHHQEAARPDTITGFFRTGRDLAFHGAFGAAVVAGRDLPELETTESWETVRRVLVGVVIAIPLLLVFGWLFVSADEFFGDTLRRVAAVELSAGIVQGLALATVFSWVMLGILRRAVTRPRPPQPAPNLHRLGLTESMTTMWLINGLFALFVAFQVFEVLASYRSDNVSYAQQARNGFFQLVAVAVIVVAVVLLMDWWVEVGGTGRSTLRAHYLALIGLTTAVLVSALARMVFYVEAYGLTELRFYSSAFMVWIGFLLLWLVRTVLAGRRQRFARPALAALLTVFLLLSFFNPDGIIAAYNLDNHARSGPAVDTAYLVSALSADAIPTILQRLDGEGDACAQLELITRLTVAPTQDIRSWNLTRSNASDLVTSVRDNLEGSCQPP